MRRGGWCEGGGGERGQRRQAGGAVPRGGGHRVPMLLLADAVEDLPCVTWSHSSAQTHSNPLRLFTNVFCLNMFKSIKELKETAKKIPQPFTWIH